MSLRPVVPMRSLLSGPSRNASVDAPRIDWPSVRDRIDLIDVATTFLGAPDGRRGERSTRRLWWVCPFHPDQNPSFCIESGGHRWRCWGCGAKGDAIDLVRRLNPGWTFPEAVAYLTGQPIPSGSPARRPVGPARTPIPDPARPPDPADGKPPERPRGMVRVRAERLVAEASERIWKPEGAQGLAYLRGRCLTESTILAARLGWTPRADDAPWKPPGWVIPWFDGDRLALVKIRVPNEWRERFPRGRKRPPRYIEVFRDRATLFPGPEAIRPGMPVVIAEGEFDALLLGQELGDLATVVTFGSSSMTRPEVPNLGLLLPCPVWFLATDGDGSGDGAAKDWPRVRRVRPPAPDKDWTEAAQSGVNLRRWWSDRLAGIQAPERSTWDEMVERHGPGVVADGPVRPTPDGPTIGPADEFDRRERAAIMEFDGGLTPEAAARAAGLD